MPLSWFRVIGSPVRADQIVRCFQTVAECDAECLGAGFARPQRGRDSRLQQQERVLAVAGRRAGQSRPEFRDQRLHERCGRPAGCHAVGQLVVYTTTGPVTAIVPSTEAPPTDFKQSFCGASRLSSTLLPFLQSSDRNPKQLQNWR